jgi:predicted dehydrogenase
VTVQRVLIIGFGSIGARHARLVQARGAHAAVVSRRGVEWPAAHSSIEAALGSGPFDFAIVANETAAHWPTLSALRAAGFSGPVLLEKPLATALPPEREAAALGGGNVRVAYNLRFHPALRRLKAALADRRVVSVCLYAGQDLRAWRPDRAAESTYSASRAQGGGVLRDLSHELDYFAWLFGEWQGVAAHGGHVGPLPIDTDDCWSILIATRRCPVASIHLDYYHRPGARLLVVNTGEETITLDLVRHAYRDGSGETVWPVERDTTYVAQLDAFLDGRAADVMCTFDEGLRTLAMIAAVERAAGSRAWVTP